MRFASHALLAACCATALSVQAQSNVSFAQTSYVPTYNAVLIRNIIGPDGRYYDARFNWDAATNSLKADLTSLAVSTASPPNCGVRLLYEVTLSNDGFATPVTKQARIELLVTGDLNQRKLYLSFMQGVEDNGYQPEVRPYFFPERLRLVQNGTTYGVSDITNSAAPHFLPDNNWQPHLTSLKDYDSYQGTISNFPASFDLSKPFYIYYGKGTPTTPAADGTDSYTLCSGS